MKRILTAALALSLLGGSAALAEPYGHDNRNDRHEERHDSRNNHDGRHDNGQHRGQHKWARGERLPTQYRTRGYYVDYRAHHLRQPPRGYQWVRVDNNYVMVALASGLIASIIAGQ